MAPSSKSTSAFRTPLAVLGGFALIAEGILSLIASVEGPLTTPQRWFVLGSMVVIMLATLFMFYLLVEKHHHKLYAPFEYRSDDAFIRTLTPQESVLKAKMEDIAPPTSVAADDSSEFELPTSTSRSGNAQPASTESPQKRYHRVENQVLELLARSPEGIIRQEVKIQSGDHQVWLDAIFQARSATVAIEIKSLTHWKNLKNAVVAGATQASEGAALLRLARPNDKVYALVLVIVEGEGLASRGREIWEQLRRLRLFSDDARVHFLEREELNRLCDLPDEELAQDPIARELWQSLA